MKDQKSSNAFVLYLSKGMGGSDDAQYLRKTLNEPIFQIYGKFELSFEREYNEQSFVSNRLNTKKIIDS